MKEENFRKHDTSFYSFLVIREKTFCLSNNSSFLSQLLFLYKPFLFFSSDFRTTYAFQFDSFFSRFISLFVCGKSYFQLIYTSVSFVLKICDAVLQHIISKLKCNQTVWDCLRTSELVWSVQMNQKWVKNIMAGVVSSNSKVTSRISIEPTTKQISSLFLWELIFLSKKQ